MESKHLIEQSKLFLDNFFNPKGYKYKRTTYTGLKYEKKEEYGLTGINISILNYSVIKRLNFTVYREFDYLEELTKQIYEKLNPGKEYIKVHSLGISYHPNGDMSRTWQSNQIIVDRHIVPALTEIIEYMEREGFPLLSRFEDLREIDKVINNLDDLWDWDVGKPFSLGGNFDVKRVIIAKLSGNPRYEEVVDMAFRKVEEGSARDGYPFVYDRKDLALPIPYTVHFLKDIKPLYKSYE
jgi:hypothetical protein